MWMLKRICLVMAFTSVISNATAEQDTFETLKILELTRVDYTTWRTIVDTSVGSTPDVELLIIIDNVFQHSAYGLRSDYSNEVFEFFAGFDLFFYEKVKLTFTSFEEHVPAFKGHATLQMKYVNLKSVAVAGTEQIDEGSYLRVSCGELEKIKFSEKTCLAENSPCYFRINGDIGNETKWCTDIANEAGAEDEKVSVCSEETAPFKEIPKEEVPMLFLVDHRSLYLLYDVDQPFIEVLALNPVDGSVLSNETSVSCESEVGDEHVCSVEVDIAESMMDVNFLVVFASEEGFTEASDTYLFESFLVQIEYLPDDTASLSWTTDDSSTEFSVIVTNGFHFDQIKDQMSVTCTGQIEDVSEVLCHAFLNQLNNGDVVSVQKKWINTAVSIPVSIPDYN